MNEIQVFGFEGKEVRVVEIDGTSWWVAKDVCDILGYRMSSDMTRRLDEDEKGTHKTRTPSGDQEMTVINESGLYNAIIGSSKPEAKSFKKWVTSEVLPSIRKTGSYSTGSRFTDGDIQTLVSTVDRLARIVELQMTSPLQPRKPRTVRPAVNVSARFTDKFSSDPQLSNWKDLKQRPKKLEACGLKFISRGYPESEYLAIDHNGYYLTKVLGRGYKVDLIEDPAYAETRQVRMAGGVTTCLLFKWDML